MDDRRAVFTIISKNYLAYARTLMATVAELHPEWDRFVLLVDRNDGYFDPLNERFRVLDVEELPIPEKRRMFFRYNILELNTAVKPWFFRWLFDRDYHQVVYFDPDILVCSRLDEAQAALKAGALAVLTPHLTGRLRDHKRPSEHDVLQSGTYNLGFIALARHQQLDELLEYWCDKSLADFCVDLSRGLFTDQKWMDLVPGLFSDVHILRHPGYNVAYWNLAHRSIERRGERYWVNGSPLVFFHFSGVDPDHPELLSKHQDRFQLADLPALAPLLNRYCSLLEQAGFDWSREFPYAFDRLTDGTPIIPEMRAIYRNNDSLREAAGSDPFACSPTLFNGVWSDGSPPITHMMRAVYESRSDVRAAFPDVVGAGREAFAWWFINSGTREHRLPPEITEPIEAHFRNRPLPETPRNGTRLGTAVLLRARELLDVGARKITDLVRGRSAPPRKSWTPPGPAAKPTRASVAEFTGFHPRCAEDTAHGIAWMSARAAVLLPKSPAGVVLSIKGEHPGEPLRIATGSEELRLWLEVDDRPAGELQLAASQPFETRISLPEGARRLVILASNSFVPARAGLGPDIRALSVKIAGISIDGVPLLDFSAPGHPYRSEPGAVRGINVFGHLAVPTGVGQVARVYSRCCASAGIPHAHIDLDGNEPLWGPAPVDLLCVNLDQVPVIHDLIGRKARRDHYRVSVSAWELEELPDLYLSAFEFLDEIWAPSRFVADCLGAKSPIPVVHMPYATEFEVDGSIGREELGLPTDAFLFLCMYDMRSFQARKNPEGAIAAFRRAFPNGGARLVVKVNHGADDPQGLAKLREALEEVPGAILLDRTFTAAEVHALQANVDAHVSLHRSEGWGFNLSEAMYLGKPVVATGWSGNLDFMSHDNSCLVDYSLVKLDRDYGPYSRGQRWADPDVEQAATHMRRLAEDGDYARRIGDRAQKTIREEFSARKAGERIRRRLQLIERLL